jgi:carbonic anhydrase
MSLETLLDRNKAFAATDAVAKNPKILWIPNQLSYIITCIDSRAEPAAFLGVGLGDATVQRVVGGRVTPAVLRDVAYISYLTETRTPDGPWWELAVIHHTDCGSTLLADPELRRDFAACTARILSYVVRAGVLRSSDIPGQRRKPEPVGMIPP